MLDTWLGRMAGPPPRRHQIALASSGLPGVRSSLARSNELMLYSLSSGHNTVWVAHPRIAWVTVVKLVKLWLGIHTARKHEQLSRARETRAPYVLDLGTTRQLGCWLFARGDQMSNSQLLLEPCWYCEELLSVVLFLLEALYYGT